MRAAVVARFDGPLEIQNLDIPVPQPGPVLVRIGAARVAPGDRVDETNESIDDVLASRVPARLVLRP